ncbi:UNVERIFIED_CONTAM: hypothetical protein FKN15_033483 [Acipenser sinensis]
MVGSLVSCGERQTHCETPCLSLVSGEQKALTSTTGWRTWPLRISTAMRTVTPNTETPARDTREVVTVHGARQEEVIDHRLTDREWAEEWKHLDNVRVAGLLNCIMDMVEKTRRSLTVLRRCQEADREEMNHWIRRYSDAEDMKKGVSSSQRPPPPPVPHNSSSSSISNTNTSSNVSEVQPLEEAVNEVKRQAMSELQKAVSDAERKAHEMISAERSKMEQALAEAKRQASEDALTVINQQEDSSESCWNCGRKASETCSGCNTARYCGSFCQHKDWEKHHHMCGQGLQGGSSVPLGTHSTSMPPTHSEGVPSAPPSVTGSAQASGGSCSSTAGSPKEASSSNASRSTTPATPALLDSASR